jgi:predicted RND superfamily exporter protein
MSAGLRHHRRALSRRGERSAGALVTGANRMSAHPEPRSERLLRAWVGAVIAHPWRVLLLIALVTAGLATRLGSLRVHIDTDDNLPQRHAYVRADAKVRAVFGGRNVIAITVVPAGGSIWNRDTLATIARITEAGSRLPGVIRANVVSLAAPKVKDVRGTAEGIEARQIMPVPPTDPAAIAAVAAAVARNDVWVGSIVSRSGAAAAIYLDFRESMSDEEIFTAVRTVVAGARATSADAIYVTGGPAYVYYLGELTRETLRLFGVAVLVIMAALYLAFRSTQGTLLPIATALLSTVWGLGAMALAGAALDGWNAMAPILTVAVAAGHSVQILKRFYEEYDRLGDVRAAVVESTVRIGVVMLTAGLIAAASFASLVAFGIASIRVFGLFTAAGIAAALVLEMSFIPACRVLLPAPPPHATRPGSSPPSPPAGRSSSTTRSAPTSRPTTRRGSARTRSSATSAAPCRSTSSSRGPRRGRSRSPPRSS